MYVLLTAMPPRTLDMAKSMKPCIDQATLNKDLAKFNGLNFSASRAGSHYAGSLPMGLGSVVYQFEGNKLMASVDAMEMCLHGNPAFESLLGDESCQATIKWGECIQQASANLRDLDAEACHQDRVPSLRISYIIPGDLFYIPFFSLVCEKSLGMNISFRVVSCLVDVYMKQKVQLLLRVWPAHLDLDWVLSVYFISSITQAMRFIYFISISHEFWCLLCQVAFASCLWQTYVPIVFLPWLWRWQRCWCTQAWWNPCWWVSSSWWRRCDHQTYHWNYGWWWWSWCRAVGWSCSKT